MNATQHYVIDFSAGGMNAHRLYCYCFHLCAF